MSVDSTVDHQRSAPASGYARWRRAGAAVLVAQAFLVDLETAAHAARIVARLRRTSTLVGRSKLDLWIAAWAVQHASALATRNGRHVSDIRGLEVSGY